MTKWTCPLFLFPFQVGLWNLSGVSSVTSGRKITAARSENSSRGRSEEPVRWSSRMGGKLEAKDVRFDVGCQ